MLQPLPRQHSGLENTLGWHHNHRSLHLRQFGIPPLPLAMPVDDCRLEFLQRTGEKDESVANYLQVPTPSPTPSAISPALADSTSSGKGSIASYLHILEVACKPFASAWGNGCRKQLSTNFLIQPLPHLTARLADQTNHLHPSILFLIVGLPVLKDGGK